MIRSFIDRLLGKGEEDAPAGASAGARSRKKRFGQRVEVPPEQHGIDLALVDARAVQVVQTLKSGGYEAYIVGGAVRDLLLGLRPKDFDVATNATPEEVKVLFRRAFIIGRRFRIVHVVFGRGREHEVIEVSTFRAYLDPADADHVDGNEKTAKKDLANSSHAVDASGRVLRDNVWGPQDEDAARRDFTVNAMYYDPQTQILVDYHKGIQDSRARVLRMIGDAAARYREDPVRLIRAVRFAAKLSARGFTLEPKTAKPIAACKSLLADVPQSRMFDEMLKLLQTGHGIASVQQLRHLGMDKGVYPLLDLIVARADEPMVHAALADTDRRVAEGKGVAPSFLLACVLWQDVLLAWMRYQERGEHPHPALQQAIDDVFANRIGDVSGRGKLAADMREIWMMQPRFDKRSGKAPYGLVEQARFRASFDFLRLRAETGEADITLADWWQAFSQGDEGTRETLVQELKQERNQRGQGARVHRVAKGSVTGPAAGAEAAHEDDAAHDAMHDAPEGEPGAAAKKRRRRRKKPSNAARTADAGGDSPSDGGADGGAHGAESGPSAD